jgi:hypothetical protein
LLALIHPPDKQDNENEALSSYFTVDGLASINQKSQILKRQQHDRALRSA